MAKFINPVGVKHAEMICPPSPCFTTETKYFVHYDQTSPQFCLSKGHWDLIANNFILIFSISFLFIVCLFFLQNSCD